MGEIGRNYILSILIVDDEWKAVRIMEMHIKSLDSEMKVYTAYGGLEAVNFCRENQMQPDYILMDLEMPNLNGFVATKTIKTEFPKIKIIAVTAYSDCMKEFKKCGGDGYIIKPIDFKDLQKAIVSVSKGISYFPDLNRKDYLE